MTGLGSPACPLIADVLSVESGKPTITVTLTNADFLTTGAPNSTCTAPTQTAAALSNTTVTCQPQVNNNGTLSTTVSTGLQQVGCANGIGAWVAVTCAGTATVGSREIDGDVTMWLTNSCGMHGVTANVIDIGGYQLEQPNAPPNTQPIDVVPDVETCDGFFTGGLTCSANCQCCQFNALHATITVSEFP